MSDQDVTGRGRVRAEQGEVVDVARVELEREVERLRHRVVELESTEPTRPRHGVRRVIAGILATLTVIALVASTVAVWMRATAFDTDEFMAAAQPALESPETAAALSTRLTDETIAALELEDRIGTALADLGANIATGLADVLDLTPAQVARVQSLPLPGLEQLAGPIAGGLEERIAARIDQFVTSEQFQTLLVDLTTIAHTKAVALVRGDEAELPNLVVESGEVQLDLVPIVARILSDLVDQGLAVVGVDEIPFIDPAEDPEVALATLSGALGVELPPDYGKVTVMSEAELTEIQQGVRTADQLVWVLVLGTVALAALTLAVAPDRRRALLWLSIGTGVGLVLTMLLLRNAQDEIASVAATPQGEEAVLVLTDSTLDTLRSVMVWVLLVALLVAAVAYAAGRPAWARRASAAVRRATTSKPGGSDVERFIASHHDLLRIGVVALGVLALAITGITLLSVGIVAGLVLLALWGLAVGRDRAGRVPAGRADADAPTP